MDYFINLFKQSLKPSGSINRLDFWIIILMNYGLVFLFDWCFIKLNIENILLSFPLAIYGILFTYITIVNARKRLHDAGFSSLWWLLIIFGISISKGVRPENYSGFIFLLECIAFIPILMSFFPSKLTNNKYRLPK